uniref:Truncated thymidine kinase n=1 Tax=Human herpesvirus 1 TaxID=10298 RepID=C0L342_HHV1|nr:truncated thymidine kinase [Human alphaherpesvirus 1]
MASYPCHQHASAFDQAARSRGHSNRRTALRPRRQQEATEVRLEQKMPTLLRVYIDGPHGMGKTTTTQLLVALGSRDDIVYVPEPMTYWQVLGASETIANIYTTQHRLDQGEISARGRGGGNDKRPDNNGHALCRDRRRSGSSYRGGGWELTCPAPGPHPHLRPPSHRRPPVLPGRAIPYGQHDPPGRAGVRGPHPADLARHKHRVGGPSGGQTHRPPGQTPAPRRAA